MSYTGRTVVHGPIIYAYLISIAVVIGTTFLLRLVLFPVIARGETQHVRLSVQEQVHISYVGSYGPVHIPVVADAVSRTWSPAYTVSNLVRDEATEQWSNLLPSLDLISAHISSLPTIENLGKMRVGLTNELPSVELSSTTPATLRGTDGAVIAQVPAHEVVIITPLEVGYNISTTTLGVFSSSVDVRFAARSGGIVTVENFENHPAWDVELNDNEFRGAIEVARSSDGSTWVVNVLRLGAYVRGIAETSDYSPVEYQKALAVAARTYTVYNMLSRSKHPGEPYILDSTANDQVYRGYGLEKRAPAWAASARSTRGQILTYDGEVIVAPYFSSSDGRTRAWSEVWNGDKPWAVSVDDPGCIGLALSGHGVGMSGTGGVYFADTGYTFEQILYHYYTGVDVMTLE